MYGKMAKKLVFSIFFHSDPSGNGNRVIDITLVDPKTL